MIFVVEILQRWKLIMDMVGVDQLVEEAKRYTEVQGSRLCQTQGTP